MQFFTYYQRDTRGSGKVVGQHAQLDSSGYHATPIGPIALLFANLAHMY